MRWLVPLLLALAAPAQAERAVPLPGAVADASWRGALTLALPLDRPVPWRVAVEEGPWRLVLDTAEVDWSALPPPVDGDVAVGLLQGRVAEGWSRLVMELSGPMRIERAWMETGEGVTLHLELAPGAAAVARVAPAWEAPDEAALATAPERRRQTGDRPLVVALDPGHGGEDPGALREELSEAELMLSFARELAEVLRRNGHIVVLTREEDVFVALRARASIARAAGADLMVSLHADALEGGGASGATVYTLSDEASDTVSAELAARLGRDDLVVGLELQDPGDEVARVLLDLARTETDPRADMLARQMVAEMNAAGIRLHKRPRLEAGFTVLKAPDIPSVLVELGFLSSQADRRNLRNPRWRSRMAQAIATAIEAWAVEDAAAASNLRR
ncbi:N-acetylmuramoyl-L-alanine amidase family protein [Jannaschia seohaensis]|uniref:N-acetylmuramoyl-L-alanine amidase n=1 Tax=Jannaschia seohaensis TaxID=475081 RepID=A0A2Y9BWC4_9RHOB|nr:N-acetylmuramoyl-L-alanine amidase [Jannaschia seohaensis]PWJ22544.1 N-acetylmuramoyl-L-alanine amidase [Jannaschia seohaensis]SSA38822.1 N-acetylmuramoyl-L-alanine amidase [Jannaschia seohaensis]